MNRCKNLKKLMACGITAAMLLSSVPDISMAKTNTTNKYLAYAPSKSASTKTTKGKTTTKATKPKGTTNKGTKVQPSSQSTIKLIPVISDAKDRYAPNEQIKLYVTTSGTKAKVQYMVTLVSNSNGKKFDLTSGYTKGLYDSQLKCLVPFSVKASGKYTLTVTSRIKSGKKYYTGSKTISFVIAEPINVEGVSLEDVNLKVGDNYDLPKKVTAKMKDGTSKDFDIVWNPLKVDTSKVGNYVFKGKINGYDKEVLLKVNISNDKIVAIDNISENINEGTAYNLPLTVRARYESGTVKEVPIKWDNTLVYTDRPGNYVFDGLVDGYQGRISLNLTINPVTLVINSITSDNLKEIKVSFNKKVDFSTVRDDNFRLFKDNKMIASTVKLTDDGMTAVITPDYSNLDNNGRYTLVIDNVRDISGSLLAKATREVVAYDNTAPTVVGVKPVGPMNLVLEFSEPIKDAGNRVVEVKNGKNIVSVYPVFTGYNSKTINVTLNSVMTTNAQYDVSVRGFKDFGDFECTPRNLSFTYVQDKTPVKASVDYADPSYVFVKFNKPVMGLVREEFYHTMATYVPLGIYSDASMTTTVNPSTLTDRVWVKFYDKNTRTGNPIPEGIQKLYVLDRYNSNEIKDAYGNKYSAETLPVSVKFDKTLPEVTSIKQETESVIIIEFSKDVKFNMSNLDLIDSSGSKVYGYSVTGRDKKYTINFGRSMAGQNISINIKNVEDNEIIPNRMNNYNSVVTMIDKKPAQVLSVSKKFVSGLEQSLYIAFSKPVSESALNAQNYYLQDASTFNIVNKFTESPSFFNGNTVIRLPITDEQRRMIESGYNIFVSNIQDTNGNLLPGQTIFNSKIVNYDSKDNRPKVTKLEAKDNKTLAVTFNQRLGRVDMDAFTLNGGSPAAIRMDTDNSGNTIVYLTCSRGREFESDFSSANLKISIDSSKRVENIFGVEAESDKFTKYSSIKIEDRMAPGVKVNNGKAQVRAYANTSGKIDAVVIEYEKEIDPTRLSALSYNVSGREIAKVYTSTSSSKGSSRSGRFVVIELKTDGLTENTGDALYVTQVLDIYDVNGNKVAPSGETMSSIDCADPYVVQSVSGDLKKKDSKTIKFSEELSRYSKRDIEDSISSSLKGRDSLSFGWSGSILTITNTSDNNLYLKGTIKVDLEDLEGNRTKNETIWRD